MTARARRTRTSDSRVSRPSGGALLLGLVPFAAMCFSVFAWDRVNPLILDLPFNLFWLLSWTVLTPLCMLGAYRLESRRDASESPKSAGEAQ